MSYHFFSIKKNDLEIFMGRGGDGFAIAKTRIKTDLFFKHIET